MVAEGGSLVDVLKEPYKLSPIGEAKVKDKDTIGVRVTRRGASLWLGVLLQAIAKEQAAPADPVDPRDELEKA